MATTPCSDIVACSTTWSSMAHASPTKSFTSWRPKMRLLGINGGFRLAIGRSDGDGMRPCVAPLFKCMIQVHDSKCMYIETGRVLVWLHGYSKKRT